MPSEARPAKEVLRDLPLGTVFIDFKSITQYNDDHSYGPMYLMRVDSLLVPIRYREGSAPYGHLACYSPTRRRNAQNLRFDQGFSGQPGVTYYNLRHISDRWKHTILRYGWDGEFLTHV